MGVDVNWGYTYSNHRRVDVWAVVTSYGTPVPNASVSVGGVAAGAGTTDANGEAAMNGLTVTGTSGQNLTCEVTASSQGTGAGAPIQFVVNPPSILWATLDGSNPGHPVVSGQVAQDNAFDHPYSTVDFLNESGVPVFSILSISVQSDGSFTAQGTNTGVGLSEVSLDVTDTFQQSGPAGRLRIQGNLTL